MRHVVLLVLLSLSLANACGNIPTGLWTLTQEAAISQALEPELLGALVFVESRYCQDAVSPKGAVGLGQLMPGTAAALGVDASDPAQNLAGAARYLREQLDAFGDVTLALAAYNAGPGAVSKYGGVPPYAETKAYVREVHRLYAAFVTQNREAADTSLRVFSRGQK